MKISVLIFLPLILPSHAADMCRPANPVKEIDLRSEMGPIRNQGGAGWCYGFTAADLMTHYRLKKKEITEVNSSNMTSALSVSAKHNAEFYGFYSPVDELSFRHGQDGEKAKAIRRKLNFPVYDKASNYILALKNPFHKPLAVDTPKTPVAPPVVRTTPKPFAPEDLIPWSNVDEHIHYNKNKHIISDEASSQAWINTSAAELESQGISRIASGGYISSAINASRNNFCTEGEVHSGDVGLDRYNLQQMLDLIYDSASNEATVSCVALGNIHRMLPGLDYSSISYILKHSERANAYEILINNSCKRKLSNISTAPKSEGWTLGIDYLKNEVAITKAQIELLNRMDNILDNGTPVGINFYSDFLYRASGESAKPHGASVVGKRYNIKTCEVEYILRNSYGSGCAYYKKPNNEYTACIASANAEHNDKLKNKKKSACDRGNTTEFINPKVSCEESSGYLFVAQSELGKHIFGVTYLQE
jgi:hypothetical protein